MIDQAHPVSMVAWLSEQGTRWVSRQQDRDLATVYMTLRRTHGDGVEFWKTVLVAPQRVTDLLMTALEHEELRRWAR